MQTCAICEPCKHVDVHARATPVFEAHLHCTVLAVQAAESGNDAQVGVPLCASCHGAPGSQRKPDVSKRDPTFPNLRNIFFAYLKASA